MPARKVASAPLEGRNARQLIRQLASGKKTQVQLAAQYGVTQGAVSQFATRHAQEVQQLKDDASSALDELWISDKGERLRVLMAQVEEAAAKKQAVTLLREWLASAELTDDERIEIAGNLSRAAAAGNAWANTAQKALRNAAEELGQLPATMPRVEVNDNRITYEVVGVDLGKMV